MKVPEELQFATPADHEGKKAQEKADWLWDRIIASAYAPVERPDVDLAGPLTMLRIAAPRATLERTFDRTDDLMETERPKIIHRQGAVARIELETEDDSPFTGVLAPMPVGGAEGVVRLSLVAPVTGKKAFTPGLGIKLFVDGQPSLDLLAMNHTVGQGRDVNPFSNPFTHDLRKTHKALRPPQKAMKLFFERVSREPRRLRIDHFGATTRAGDIVHEPKLPQRLLFRAPREIRRRFRRRELEDFRDVLSELPAGTTLYEVEAIEGETDDGEMHDRGTVIGRIVLTEPFVASRAGDRLFFRHVQAPDDRISS